MMIAPMDGIAAPSTFRKPTKLLYIHMANTVPTMPLTITKNFFEILVILAKPSPEA
ncbi:hypothetical protein D3C85_1877910 [compost metagenome]